MPWAAARQASLSITNSRGLLKFMSIESVMPPNHICHPLLLLPSFFASIRVFSYESVLHIRWPKYFSFSVSPCNEYAGVISFTIDWFELLAVQGTLKSLLQQHSSKPSILQHSAFFTIQISHPYISSVQFSHSIMSTLCNLMDYSTPVLPIHHQLPELAQIHVHRVGDAIQPSHPLMSPSPPAFKLSQNQGIFQGVRFSHQVEKVLEFQLQHQSFQWTPRLISFRMDWLDLLAVQGTLKNLLQHNSSKASILQRSAFFTVQLSHPYMTTGKTITLTRQNFVGKIMSLLLNMLSRLVITFLPRSKCLLISWLQSPSAVILEPKKIKSDTVSTVSPSISHDVMGPDAMILVFWMLSFKPTFLLSSFTFIERLLVPLHFLP